MQLNSIVCIRTCHISQLIHLSVALPHSVGQSQDAQAEEVDGQQQVDVLLRKYLRESTRLSNSIQQEPDLGAASDATSDT